MNLHFTVPGEPVGKARPKVTKNGTFTPKKSRDYAKLASELAKLAMKGNPPVSGPVRLTVRAVFPVRKSWGRKKQNALRWTPHLFKPDLDNIIKQVADAMNGIVYLDDSQIDEYWECAKLWGDEGKVEVFVEARDG